MDTVGSLRLHFCTGRPLSEDTFGAQAPVSVKSIAAGDSTYDIEVFASQHHQRDYVYLAVRKNKVVYREHI